MNKFLKPQIKRLHKYSSWLYINAIDFFATDFIMDFINDFY